MACAGSVVLTQTHPAASYVCRTGNITLRCQYGGVENVLGVVWAIGNETTTDPSTIPGHTALPRTTTYQEIVVDSYTNSREKNRCDLVLSNGTVLLSNEYDHMIECEHEVQLQSIHTVVCMHELVLVSQVDSGLKFVFTAAEVILSSLTLASRTATTLSVTWSAGYPKCYSFTVSHSTQDSSITVTQHVDSDTSQTLTSLQPGTTYKIEVEAVRKGDRADGQRAKVTGNFVTDEGNS